MSVSFVQYMCPECQTWRLGHQGGARIRREREASNLVVACRPCNLRKGARTPEQAGMVLRSLAQEIMS